MPFERCEDCGREVRIGAWPFCPHERAFSHRPFHEYEVDLGGMGRERITCLQDATRIERRFEQMYRNGDRDPNGKLVGPIVLRAFHQNKSNLDKNCLGDTHYRKPQLGKGHVGGAGEPRGRE